MQAGAVHDADEIGVRRPDHTPVAALGPGETGYLIAGIKDVREARSGETVTDAARPATEPLAGLPRAQADGVLRPLPDRRRPVLRPARRPREAPAQRRLLHLRTRDLRRARLRLPVRVPRAAPHGDHPGAARPRVQPRPHRHRPVGRVPGAQDRRRRDRGGQPLGAARGGEHRLHRGADAHLHDPHAEGLHRHDHGALPEPAGRDEQARVPLARAGRADLQDPARRGGARLLRPAEEPHAGLRVARLRAGRATSAPTWSRSTCC